MPQRNSRADSSQAWDDYLRHIDELIHNTILQYEISVGSVSDADLRSAFAELAFSGPVESRNPDYDQIWVPPLYALRYTIQRMTTVVSGLVKLEQSVDIAQQRVVLDLGSGSDTVYLALKCLDLLADGCDIVCCERSEPMIRFAKIIDQSAYRSHHQADFNQFIVDIGHRTFDSIFLSYAFDYDQNYSDEYVTDLCKSLANALSDNGFIMYCGPAGFDKRRLANLIRNAFRKMPDMRLIELSDGWPSHLTRQRTGAVPQATRKFREYYQRVSQAGLDPAIMEKYTSPYTDGPSVIYTATGASQEIFAAIRTS